MSDYKILIVEDDAAIAGVLSSHLSHWGMEARCAGDFSDVTGEFVRFAPHLVLMDISLPFYNGYHWCAEIRRLSQVPLLFLSSAGDNLNQVMAMDLGADGFIVKPFDLDVLTARVRALLRRTYSFGDSAGLLEYGGVVLNLAGAALSWNGRQTELTKNEFRILEVLMENPGAAVSRDTLMKHLWQSDCFIDDNTLTVNIARLRRKLEELGLGGFVATRKGLGYQVCLPEEHL